MVKHSVAKKVATGVLVLIAFCCITLGVSSVTLRGIFADRTMTNIVSSINVRSGDTTIDDWVYLYLEEHYPDYMDEFYISQGSVSYILDETDFATFLANKLMDYTHDILASTGTGQMTSDEFMDFIEENREVVEHATRSYSDEELVVIRDYIRTMLMFDDISLEAICEKIGMPLNLLRIFVSIPFSIGCVLAFLIALIGIYLLNRKKPYLALFSAGTVIFILGIIYTVFIFTFASVIENVAYRIEMGASLVGSIVAPVSDIFLTVCIASYSVSILLLAGHFLLHRFSLAKQSSKEAESPVVDQEECA